MILLARKALLCFVLLTISIAAYSQSLYWVGNGGSWNDANNWSTTSGGPGGAGIPTISDDVVFDGGSGTCTIAAAASTQSISYASDAQLIINSDLTVALDIDFTDGEIINNGTITAGSIYSLSQSVRTFDSQAGTIIISAVDPMIGTFSFDSDNLIFTGIDSLIFRDAELTRLSTVGSLGVINYLEFMTNGEIYGDHEINTLRLLNSKSLYLENSSTQIINTDLVTNDPCVGYATISGFLSSDTQATLDIRIQGNYKPAGFFFRRIDFLVFVQGVRFPIDLRDSIDGGENGGENGQWADSSNPDSRVLYWVGGDGDWYDPDHWSLESGGPGGECTPTSIDDIIFDNNSFDSDNNVVFGNSAGYCNNISYLSSRTGPTISIPELYINNDLTITTPFNWLIGQTYLSGNREGGASQMQKIETSGTLLQNLTVYSERNIELQDDLNVRFALTINSFAPSVSFITNGHDITTNRFFVFNNQMPLDLTDSYITVTGGAVDVDLPLVIRNSRISSASGTRWEFTNEISGLESDVGPLGSVWFSHVGGMAFVFNTDEVDMQSLRLEGSGQIFQDNFIIDSLIFTAGNSYTIQSLDELTVNEYFESLGDICNPITFGSFPGGIPQTFFMPASATVDMSYTSISDIQATGGNTFDAGPGSVDQGGNSGWSFRDPDAQEVDRFLGEDIRQCNSDDNLRIELNFAEGEADSIIWNNGSSTDPNAPFLVPTRNSPPGEIEITAEVFYSNGCSQADTLLVTIDEAFSIELGADTTICNGDSLLLAVPDLPTATYMWSTSAAAPTINVADSDTYSIEVTRGACSAMDDITVTAIDLTELNIGRDTVLCEASTLTLDAPAFGGDILWSTGSTASSITIDESGEFWADFTQDICSFSDTIEVTFDAAFALDLGVDTTICNGESLTLSTGINAGTVEWSTGETTADIVVNTGNTYIASVQIGSCTDTDTIVVDRVDIKEFSLGDDQRLCDGEAITLSIPEGFQGDFDWSTGESTEDISVATTGTYHLTIRENICEASDTVDITFDTSFDINIGEDTTLCAGETLLLTTDVPDADYKWSDGSTGSELSVSTADSYSVEATRGACTVSDTIEVSVAEVAAFEIGSDTSLCSGETLDLSVSLDTDQSVMWSTGEMTETITVSTTEEYTAVITEGTCTNTASIRVTFDEPIDFDLGADTTLCSGETLTLSTGVTDAAHLWSTGSSDQMITASMADLYIVELSRGACTATDSIDVSIIDVDNFTIGNDTTLCEGETLILSAELSDQASYEWQDGSNDPTFNVTEEGPYSVIASIERCSAMADINVSFQTAPMVDLGRDTTVCSPATILLAPGVGGATYLWQDGSTDETFEASLSGEYFVDIDDGVCLVSDTVSITVQNRPDLSIAAMDAITFCEGDSVILTAGDQNGLTYLWQDGTSEPTLTASTSGLYIAEMTIDACTIIDSVDITANPNPTVELPADMTICEGSELVISTAADPTFSYSWTGISSDESSITVTTDGTYSVTVTDANSCTASDEIIIDTKPTPVFSLGEDQTICEGQTATISASEVYPNFTWSVANNGSSILTTTDPGIVWAEVVLDGCPYRDSVEITVQAYPIVELGNDTTICAGDQISLDAAYPDAEYIWSTGETTPTISLTGSGTYSVDVSILGCSVNDRINIMTKEIPDFSLQEDETICEGESFDLMIENPGRWDISWSTGETTDVINISETGTYSVTATIDGCEASDEFALSVQPLPTFDLGDDFSKCEDLTAILTIDRQDVDVIWQDGTIGNSIIAENPGTYTAIATTNLGCEFTDEVTIENRECVEFAIYVPNAFSPNDDGRNDEFIATVAEGIFIQEFDIQVFDKWGNKVFESSDINQGWTGSGLGYESLQPGVYVYHLRVRYSDDYNVDIEEDMTGNITLIE